jgi:8-oxo-dGTP pyrophosphatase MutT (NUDIX family)
MRKYNSRKNPQEATVAAVVVIRDGSALILQRGYTAPWEPGKWNLPGGGIDYGETPLEGAIRETFEETGINLHGVDIKSLGLRHFDDWTLETFVAVISDRSILPEHIPQRADRERLLPISEELGFAESIDYRWIPRHQIDDFEYVPTVRESLHKAMSAATRQNPGRRYRRNPVAEQILIYDVGSTPYMAPLQGILDERALEALYREISQKVDSPEISGSAAEILEDNRGSDEYEDLKALSEGTIDYFVLGAAGGSLDLLVAVRSSEDYLKFIDHMVNHYAADVSIPGRSPKDLIYINASRGKFSESTPV